MSQYAKSSGIFLQIITLKKNLILKGEIVDVLAVEVHSIPESRAVHYNKVVDRSERHTSSSTEFGLILKQ